MQRFVIAIALSFILHAAVRADEGADGVEAGLKEKMLTPEAQQQLPDEAMLPDYFATLATATENGDEAEVDLGRALFKLHRATDASGKPRWLICSADQ